MPDALLYQKFWRRLEIWHGLWIGSLTFGLILWIVLGVLDPEHFSRNSALIIFVVLPVNFISAMKFRFLLCPRCRKYFVNWQKSERIGDNSVCRHCGLEIFEGSTYEGFWH